MEGDGDAAERLLWAETVLRLQDLEAKSLFLYRLILKVLDLPTHKVEWEPA
jgi:hypothetical protein